ncbi:hypothetical protein GCM10023066_49200 [Nocardioides kongjuensis]
MSDVDSSAMRAMTLKASSGFSPLIGRFVRGQCLAARRHEGVGVTVAEPPRSHTGFLGRGPVGAQPTVVL